MNYELSYSDDDQLRPNDCRIDFLIDGSHTTQQKTHTHTHANDERTWAMAHAPCRVCRFV